MRIAHIAYSLDIGGVEMVSRDLACGLTRKEHKCAVCALERGGVLEDELQAAGVDTHVIDRMPDEYLMPMWRISSFLRRFKPDVVHTHQLYILAYTALPASLSGIPLIHTEHQTTSLKSRKAKRGLLNLARLCRFVTGVSEEVTDFLCHEVGIPTRKLRTISNGIDLDRFRIPEGRAFQTHDQEPVTLASVARLSPVKDHATLLRAFAMMHNTFPQTRLILIGDGELRSELESLSDELGLHGSVRFLGARRNVEKILNEVDIFVLSSKTEGLPVAMLEAMAAGSIVVSTRVGAVPEVIRDGETGFLVDPEDPVALATRLKEVVLRLPELSHVSHAARKVIEERYSFDNTLSEYTALYQQVLS